MKQNIQRELTRVIKQVDGSLGWFKTAKDSILKQKDLYLKKLRADFEVIYKMLEKKYSELYQKIEKAFHNTLKESDILRKGFNSYQTRLNYL